MPPGAPAAVVGVMIAALVLLPESLAAVRAARADRLQTSLNLALGSALASIGLTIPAVAVVSLVMGWPLSLGLDAKATVLLVLTLIVATLSLGAGPHHGAAGRGAPGDLRGLPLHDGRALACRPVMADSKRP